MGVRLGSGHLYSPRRLLNCNIVAAIISAVPDISTCIRAIIPLHCPGGKLHALTLNWYDFDALAEALDVVPAGTHEDEIAVADTRVRRCPSYNSCDIASPCSHLSKFFGRARIEFGERWAISQERFYGVLFSRDLYCHQSSGHRALPDCWRHVESAKSSARCFDRPGCRRYHRTNGGRSAILRPNQDWAHAGCRRRPVEQLLLHHSHRVRCGSQATFLGASCRRPLTS